MPVSGVRRCCTTGSFDWAPSSARHFSPGRSNRPICSHRGWTSPAPCSSRPCLRSPCCGCRHSPGVTSERGRTATPGACRRLAYRPFTTVARSTAGASREDGSTMPRLQRRSAVGTDRRRRREGGRVTACAVGRARCSRDPGRFRGSGSRSRSPCLGPARSSPRLHGREIVFDPTPSVPPVAMTMLVIRPSLGSIMRRLTLPMSRPSLSRTVPPTRESEPTRMAWGDVGVAGPAERRPKRSAAPSSSTRLQGVSRSCSYEPPSFRDQG